MGFPYAALGVLMAMAIAAGCGGDDGEGDASSASGSGGGGGACPDAYAECDGDPGTVCETAVTTSAEHCGSCGNACPTGAAHQVATCASGACGLACESGYVDCDEDATNGCEVPSAECGVTTVVDNVTAPMGLAVDDTHVYFGSKGTYPEFLDGTLYRVPKDGGEPVVLAGRLNRPLKIAIDGDQIFWVNGGHVDQPDGSLLFMPKRGGTPTPIIDAATRPNHPTFEGEFVYWTDREPPAGRVLRARKDGSDRTPEVIADQVANPESLAIDGGMLFWASAGHLPDGSDALIERSNLDGTGRTTIATGIARPSYRIAVDDMGLYVGSFADAKVYRVPLQGRPTTLADGVGEPAELLLDGSTLYFTTGPGAAVYAVSTAGGTKTPIATSQAFPSYIAQDAADVYWTDGSLNSPGGAVRKAAKLSP